MEYLRREGPDFLLVGMETAKRSRCYTDVKYPRPIPDNDSMQNTEDTTIFDPGVALFQRNEVSGVDTDIMPIWDEVVEIPMFGKKNSLNVAACAPVVMYEVLRQWGAFH